MEIDSMVYTFEAVIHDSLLNVLGSDMFLGLAVLAFFLGISMVQNTRVEAKTVAAGGAAILAMVYIPVLRIIMMVVGAIIIFLAWRKIERQ